MDKTIRKHSSFDEMNADECRYWQSRPVHERLAAGSELSQEHYAMKGAAPGREDWANKVSNSGGTGLQEDNPEVIVPDDGIPQDGR